MNTSEFVAKLDRQGVRLRTERDKLIIHAPKGALKSQLQNDLAIRKQEIITFLSARESSIQSECSNNVEGISLQTIGRSIGGFGEKVTAEFKPPTIELKAMAQQLKVTFRPLPDRYRKESVLRFREELEGKLRDCGVQVIPWHKATREYIYDIELPLVKWKRTLKTNLVKASISAIIDVERPNTLRRRAESFAAEQLYQLYSRYALGNQKASVSTIAKIIGWAEDHAAQRVEDPTNTQVIILTELDKEFVDDKKPYQEKISLGINTLIKNFSEIVLGVSESKISILNMNLSDSLFSRQHIDRFVSKSLIPKIYVPIAPLLLNRFQLGEYDPHQSTYATKLMQLGRELADTGLFPPGFKLSEAIKRKSHRDMVDVIANGRTGVSYGFVAYAEPPRYHGAIELDEREWETLEAVEGFDREELRQNSAGRSYLKTKIKQQYSYKQIPDLWLVSSRSGSNKTNLNLETDILRIGLNKKLLLQLPQGIDALEADIKPSYDIYVMVAMALAAALFTPELIANGAPMVHFHGYPSSKWFEKDEYYAGFDNPSVPCGTYESGVFNFLSIYQLAKDYGNNIKLASLVEPDHGTNFIAPDLDYLVTRLKDGCDRGEIELGGKHFASLTAKIA
jgi:TubC N-terminal docking domain